jgi:hypothetical protein
MYYGRKLSHFCGYTRELHLTFYKKEILHLCVYWKTTLYKQRGAEPLTLPFSSLASWDGNRLSSPPIMKLALLQCP